MPLKKRNHGEDSCLFFTSFFLGGGGWGKGGVPGTLHSLELFILIKKTGHNPNIQQKNNTMGYYTAINKDKL